MFNSEVRALLIQVITSWQVLAVTGVLILYVFLVNSVARLYRRRLPPLIMPRIKKLKPEKTKESDEESESDSDDIALEEEDK